MKKAIIFLFIFSLTHVSKGQSASQRELDSLLSQYSPAKKDTQQVWVLSSLSINYIFINPDSGLLFARKELELSQLLNYEKGIINAKTNMAIYWWAVGEYSVSAKLFTENIEYFRSVNDIAGVADQVGFMMNVHRDQGDYKEALADLHFSDSINQVINSCRGCVDSITLGSIFYEMGQYDSALFYLKSIERGSDWGWANLILGKTYARLSNDTKALKYYYISVDLLHDVSNIKDLTGVYNSLAELYKRLNRNDSALYYAKKALDLAQQKKFNKEVLQSYIILSDIYNTTDPKLAFYYLRLAFAARDTLYNQEKQREISGYKFTEELNRQQVEKTKERYQNKLKMSVLLAVLIFFAVISIILYRNIRHKQTAKLKIEKAYTELKSTQAQLIQSEKMASLGELTAGIAHEIQNPLNFVNNFSEVSTELVDEMNTEIDKGNLEDVKEIANDLKQNLEKINHHGKRAGDIVKGMLQHSRSNSGQKEPTDINKLADEYLRLAYHGLRAKDKSFNATMKTDFDETIGNINIIPQDIGRVILNLITNAFYVVDEKKKAPQPPEGGAPYEPTVSVSTKKVNDKVEIKVKDNGNGIPKKVLDKIFQPFFTTKPTGQGTGLGLSLSYDIVKAHGGELRVETKEARPDDPVGRGEGSEFIISLPV